MEQKELCAVIDIGSSSIRLSIYQLHEDDYEVIEELRQPVKLGKDSFYLGKISRHTINETIFVLKNYKKLCEEYRIDQFKAVATTAVREASNVDIFLDNVYTYTGIEVEILSPLKESEHIYKALLNEIAITKSRRKEYWSIIEIGTGNVEITILEKACVVYSRSLPLGILRLRQIFLKEFNREENFNNFLRVMIEHELQNVKRNIPHVKLEKIYGIGFEVNELPKILNEDTSSSYQISRDKLKALCREIREYTADDIFHEYNIQYSTAESFFQACLIFSKIIEFFNCDAIFTPKISLSDGVVKRLYYSDKTKFKSKVESQIKAQFVNFGTSLNFDKKHALKVTELSLKIFDNTKDMHHLGNRERLYLIGAAILHDIGASISHRAHHKHSLYIIKAQEFFYFSHNDINIIANIARYHRRSPPKKTHQEFYDLNRHDRMIVMKLAAILRIADSLDNTHLQLVKDIEIKKRDTKVRIFADVNGQFYTEQYSLKYKKRLFEDFFGVSVKLHIKE